MSATDLTLPPVDSENSRSAAASRYFRDGFPIAALYPRTANGGCTCKEGAVCARPGQHLPIHLDNSDRHAADFFRLNPRAHLGLLLGAGGPFLALVIEGDEGERLLAPLNLGTATARNSDGKRLLLFLADRRVLPSLRSRPGLTVHVDGALPLSGAERWTWTRRGPIWRLPAPLAALLATPAQAEDRGARGGDAAPPGVAEAPGPEAAAPVEASLPSSAPSAPEVAPAPVEAPSSSRAPDPTPEADLAAPPPAASSPPSTPPAAESSAPVEPPAAPPAAEPSSTTTPAPEASSSAAPPAPVLLPVLPSKNLRAWPGNEQGGAIAYRPAAEAFRQRYATDAHFAGYDARSVRRRLDKGAPGHPVDGAPLVVAMVLLTFDVDGANHQADPAWRERERAKVAHALAAHPGGFAFETRNGYRLVWRRAVPFLLACADDAPRWRVFYWRAALYLSRAFGIEPDPACADWPRIFRLPHATRPNPDGSPGDGPEALPTEGDPELLTPWAFEPAEADLAADLAEARRLLEQHPAAKGDDGKTKVAAPWGAAVKALALAAGEADEAPSSPAPEAPRAPRHTPRPGRPSLEERERLWCEKALDRMSGDVARAGQGTRNAAARDAGLILGHYAPRYLNPSAIEAALVRACEANGLIRDDGRDAALATIRKAIHDGMGEPKRPELPPDDPRDERPRSATTSDLRDRMREAMRQAREKAHAGRNPKPENDMHDQADDHDQADEQQGPASGPRPAPSTDDRPRILVDHDLARIVAESVAALAGVRSLNLYARNDALVQVLRATESAKRKDDGMPYIRPLPVDALWEMLSQHIDFYRETFRKGEGWVDVPCAPPPQAVKTLAARGTWPGLRPIVGVLETPFLRPDGSVCSAPGYDEESGYLLWTTQHFPSVPEAPTPDDARRALATLQDVFCDFPFAGDASAAVPLAAILTILARPYLGAANTPGFLFDANTRATGKSLICDVVALIATGRPAPKTGYPHDEPEMSKLLSSVALDGVPLLAFDNVTSTFGGGDLDRVLTAAGPVAFRVLGAMKSRQMPWRTIIMATGNNLQVRGDTTRRVLLCAQETVEEKPEERENFRYPELRRHVLEHRGNLVAAGLTLLRAYLAAGAPRGSVRPLGSFEAWSRLIAGALVWAGAPNPLDALAEASRDDDPQKTALRVLLMQWPKLDPSGLGITAREILALLFPPATKENPGGKPGEALGELREAIELLCESPMGKAPDARRLGTRLRSFQKRRLGGRWLNTKHGGHDKVARWVVEDLTGPKRSAGSAGSAGSVSYDRGAPENSPKPSSSREEEGNSARDYATQEAGGNDPADPADPAPPVTSTPPPTSTEQPTKPANEAAPANPSDGELREVFAVEVPDDEAAG